MYSFSVFLFKEEVEEPEHDQNLDKGGCDFYKAKEPAHIFSPQ